MQNNNISRPALFISIALHAAFLYLCMYKLDIFSKKHYDEDVYAPVEILTSDKTNLKTQTIQKDKVIENEDAKLVKQSNPEKPQEEQKKEEPKPQEQEKPKEEPKKEEPKPQEPEKPKSDFQVKEEKKPDPKKEEPRKVEPKKEESKKIEPKKEEKKPDKKKPKIPDMDQMLKNLEKESQGKNPQSKNRKIEAGDATTNIKGNSNFDPESKLSISEKNLLKSIIERNWNRVGAEKGSGFKTIIHIKLNIDGTFDGQPVVKNVTCPQGLSCDILVESVQRAVQTSAPFDGLSAERYDVWKEFEFEFSPPE